MTMGGEQEMMQGSELELVEQQSGELAGERAMRRVALLENPSSGPVSQRRKGMVRAALEALRAEGIEVDHRLIDGEGSGAELAREAIVNGCDTVLVCGGDGTVHQTLQPLVGTNVALGVLPLGTANALAANLGLAGSPKKAIHALLGARPVAVPVGRITFQTREG